MITKKISEKEFADISICSTICFNGTNSINIDPEKVKEEIQNSKLAPKSRTQHLWYEGFCAYTDDGKHMGHIKAYPMDVNFDGNTCVMTGIGGVVSYPVYRHQGAIRSCFEHTFLDMKERGFMCSSLYPFSTSYYQNFGYGTIGRKVCWTIPLNAIKPVEYLGSFELIDVKSLDEIKAVYDNIMPSYNLSSQRNHLDWARFENLDMGVSQTYGYLYRDENGQCQGYLFFSKNDRVMDASNIFGNPNEFLFRDTKTLQAMLSFAHSFSAYYDKLKFTLPEGHNIEACIKNLNDVEKTTIYPIMARIVDVKLAFTLAKYKGCGEVSIEINDTYAPWNTGVWNVKFKENKCVSVGLVENATADIILDISDFSKLILGEDDMSDIAYMPNVALIKNSDDLAKVFYKKACRVTEPF